MKNTFKLAPFKLSNSRMGMTLLETLIYAAILAVVIFMIFKSITSILSTHRRIKLAQTLENSASVSMERILREIRNANNVETSGSTFNTSPGILKLSGLDETGTAYTDTFDLSSGVLRLSKNSGTPVAMTSSGVSVSSLIFRNISNSVSQGVRVEVTFTAQNASTTRTMNLYGFSVLRGSY